MNIDISIVNVIQAMLAPGIMISACALLLLGMGNKYSATVARIRVLNEERRKLMLHAKENKVIYEEGIRMHSINAQLLRFQRRLRLVRDAVVFYSLAVASFILSSLFIGLTMLVDYNYSQHVVLVLFLTGMLFVLSGVILAAVEVVRGFKIIKIEILDI
jgi:hypothetical protein